MRQRSSASREIDRQQARLRRQNQTAQEQRRRLDEQQRRQEALRANESAEARRLRLSQDQIRHAANRVNESNDARDSRLNDNRIRQAAVRDNVRQSRRQVVYDNGDFEFFDNFNRKTEECNAYYRHTAFPNSHNHHNWEKAKKSEMFGFQRMKGYQSLELFWNKKCGHCGAMYLDGESEAFMKKCCGSFKFHGMECEPTGLPDLKPLLPSIKKAIAEEPVHMSKYAQTYNNLLSFGATGVENKRGYARFEV
jgi:hypothetical protein